MKVVALSDVHGTFSIYNHVAKNAYNADYLFLIGDMVDFGNPDIASKKYTHYILEMTKQWDDYFSFIAEASKNYKKLIYVEGNHHIGVTENVFTNVSSNIIRLENEYIELEDKLIYGTGWSYCSNERIAKAWDYMTTSLESDFYLWNQSTELPQVDMNVDVILSHCPPLNMLDENGLGSPGFAHWVKLKNEHKEKDVTIFSGHLHLDGGKTLKKENVTLYNVAQRVKVINL